MLSSHKREKLVFSRMNIIPNVIKIFGVVVVACFQFFETES
jgi:hypothetical protein